MEFKSLKLPIKNFLLVVLLSILVGGYLGMVYTDIKLMKIISSDMEKNKHEHTK